MSPVRRLLLAVLLVTGWCAVVPSSRAALAEMDARIRQEIVDFTRLLGEPAAREIMAPLVLAYLRRYPQVHIDLVTEGRLVDVVAAGFDLGVRSADFVPSDAIAIPLGQVRRMAVAASPAFFENRTIPQVPQELLSYPCLRIRLPNGALFQWRFEKDGEELQIDVVGPITLDEASLSRIAATNGIGIGYFMEADVRDDIAAGRLVRILEDWTPPLEPLCLYYSNRRNSSAALQAFIALARDFAAGRLVQS